MVEELLQGAVHKAWGEWRGSERVTFDRALPDVIVIDTGLLGIGARAFFIIFGMGSAVGTAFGKKDLKDNFGFKKY